MVNKIDFSQKIEKIQTEIIEEKAKTINGKYVYHYTSIAAFYGIIKNKELWLGNTSSMNDKSELLGFTSKIQSNLKKELPDKHNEIKEYFDLVSNRIRNEFPFALCFSTLKDDAAQWERYAQNATGVRIAFDIKVLLTLIQGIGFIFNEIFYDSPIKENLHYALLKNYFDTGILYEFSSEKSQIDNLILTASLHKHKSFASEKEYRLEFLSNEIKKYEDFLRIEFVEQNNTIKQVMKLNLRAMCKRQNVDMQDLFGEIYIGPRANQSINDIEKFCLENGFEKMSSKIKLSKCPLR